MDALSRVEGAEEERTEAKPARGAQWRPYEACAREVGILGGGDRDPWSAFESLRSLEGRYRFLREKGTWFAAALLAGALIRLFLLASSEGTLDVSIWAEHARSVLQHGVVASYHGGVYTFNHPPPMGELASWFWQLSLREGVPFAALLRAPFALLDAASTLLLVRLLAECGNERLRRARYAIAALYWLSPLAIIFSAYHGNTDSAVAFFLLASALQTARERSLAAGALLGLSLWIKIPGLLAAPLLLLALPSGRQRLRFATAFALTALLGFAPALWLDARAVVHSVFLYPGLRIQTMTGGAIWGLQIFLPSPTGTTTGLQAVYGDLLRGFEHWSTALCLSLILARSWSTRGRHSAESIGAGIADIYIILYGLSGHWAFQYLAWSLPFWLVKSWRFAVPAFGISTLYIYGLYAWLCGNPLLLGPWDFLGKPDWPLPIRLLRDTSVLFFFAAAARIVFVSLKTEFARWRALPTLR